MTRAEEYVRSEARRLGLQITTERPGDGHRWYRFDLPDQTTYAVGQRRTMALGRFAGPSSAARFLRVWAAEWGMTPGSDVTVAAVGIDDTAVGLAEVLS